MKKVLQFRIENRLLDQFKEYCIGENTTMSTVLLDYITTLVGKSPAKEKNSVLYHCPHCGMDITGMPGSDRLNHLQNCENKHNR